MLMRGVAPPEIGSVRDKLMTRMFFMDQARDMERMSTIVMALVAALKPDRSVAGTVQKILDTYRDTLGYASWSMESKKKRQRSLEDQDDILARVNALGEVKRG